MTEIRYPRLVIDAAGIRANAVKLNSFCAAHGVAVTVVTKGVNSVPAIVRAIAEGGITRFASSRLEQVRACKDAGIGGEWMLLRTPQRRELDEAVRLCAVSLQSDRCRLAETEDACVRQNVTHTVLLMADLGDLREGYYDREEMYADLRFIRDECPHLTVKGIGTDFGCISAVQPSTEKLQELVDIADKAAEIMGYPMEYVSAGGTFVVPLLADGKAPAGITHLRPGETVLLAHDLPEEFGRTDLDFLSYPTMELQVEIIEAKRKTSVPEGERFLDSFGNCPDFEDRGVRLRAVTAIGRLDVGAPDKLIPLDPGAEIIGASSDHMVVDVEQMEPQPKTGDILRFGLRYENMLYATASPGVEKVLSEDL